MMPYATNHGRYRLDRDPRYWHPEAPLAEELRIVWEYDPAGLPSGYVLTRWEMGKGRKGWPVPRRLVRGDEVLVAYALHEPDSREPRRFWTIPAWWWSPYTRRYRPPNAPYTPWAPPDGANPLTLIVGIDSGPETVKAAHECPYQPPETCRECWPEEVRDRINRPSSKRPAPARPDWWTPTRPVRSLP